MKPKDLNTYINDKLDQGNGLRYQEEYWNDMNRLLDANMPVVEPETVATKSAGKLTGFKLSYIISVCAAAIGGAIIWSQLFITPSSVSSQSNTQVNNTTPSVSNIKTPPSGSSPQNISGTPAETITNQEVAQDHIQSTGQTNNASIPPGQATPSEQISSAARQPVSNSFIPAVRSAANQTAQTPTLATAREEADGAVTPEKQASTYSSNLILIEPLTFSEHQSELQMAKTAGMITPPHLKRNRLIKHLDVSPFIGMIAETGNQTYRSGNTEYVHPAQSHFTYGINLECATRHFSIRTGVGLSTTTLQSSTTTGNDIYDVDTSYIIVNPNYGTTPSGKPIALIRRQIDSSYVSTAYTITKANTTYQYITIPLTLQYKFAYKRFTTMIEGGGLHQIMISQETNTTSNTESENRVVVPMYSFQLTAGGSIRYALTAKWAVGVQYNYNLNPSGANLHFLNNAHMGILMITHNIY